MIIQQTLVQGLFCPEKWLKLEIEARWSII